MKTAEELLNKYSIITMDGDDEPVIQAMKEYAEQVSREMIDALMGIYEITKDAIDDDQVFTKDFQKRLNAVKDALEKAGCEL